MSSVIEVAFRVKVVDGDCWPVPDQKIGARFQYESAASTWSTAVSDGDGFAAFEDEHPEQPKQVCLFVGDEWCDTFVGFDSDTPYVLEL